MLDDPWPVMAAVTSDIKLGMKANAIIGGNQDPSRWFMGRRVELPLRRSTLISMHPSIYIFWTFAVITASLLRYCHARIYFATTYFLCIFKL